MITVSLDNTKKISKGMFGLFFEDINYSLDGGLHAEMIENRNFEFFDCGGSKYNWYKHFDGGYGWSCDSDGRILIKSENPLNDINPHYAEFTGFRDKASFTNKAYDGIYMKAGLEYNVSFYARAENYNDGLSVEIRTSYNGTVKASAKMTAKVSPQWTWYNATLTSDSDVEGGAFCIVLSRKGKVCFDFVSMIPSDAVYGVFRKDLADMLKDMQPGFLRFPGGCVVEGNTLDNMYKWKLSVGEPERRKVNWNRWAVHQCNGHGPFSHYNQTLGVGYFEYFLLCEYIGAEPLPVCNVGLACQYESNQQIELEDDMFTCFVRDALDLIEFANGPTTSTWGSLRARMGHPKPFGLKMLGIGNEQWNTAESRFFKRYDIFEEIIHESYPDIRLIGSAGPDVRSEHYTDAWAFYRDRAVGNPKFTYAVDEHYYVAPEWMIENNRFYDDYSRDVKVFAGEYAAHVGDDSKLPSRNCLKAAIAEAAFMTGLERNCDLVVLASYAPLFARIGYVQWAPDMIWFDAKTCYGTPSYYVQKLFATRIGDIELTTECDDKGLYTCASRNSSNERMFLKIVNPMGRDITTELHLGDASRAIITVLKGSPSAYNTIDNPWKVAPTEELTKLTDGMQFTVPANSLVIVEY